MKNSLESCFSFLRDSDDNYNVFIQWLYIECAHVVDAEGNREINSYYAPTMKKTLQPKGWCE